MSNPTGHVFLHPDRETLMVSGADRQSWLGGLLTCDVARLEPGQGVLGLMLTATGKIQTDVWVVATEQCLFLSVSPGRGAPTMAELDRLLIMEDAELVDASQELCVVTFHPGELLPAVSPVADGAGTGPVSLVTARDGLLLLPRSRVPALEHALIERTELRLSDDRQAWHRFRVDHAFPLFGQDYTSQHTVHDASLERRAVSFSKGCYVGQEVVFMQDVRGKVKRRLLSGMLRLPRTLEVGAPVVTATGEAAGEVTSAVRALEPERWSVMMRIKAAFENEPLLVADQPIERVLHVAAPPGAVAELS